MSYKWKQHRVFHYCPWERCMSWQTRIDLFTFKCDCGKKLQATELPFPGTAYIMTAGTGESVKTA